MTTAAVGTSRRSTSCRRSTSACSTWPTGCAGSPATAPTPTCSTSSTASSRSLLDHHTSKEERGLFTQLRACNETDDRLDTLIGEHRTIEAAVSTIRTRTDGWRGTLVQLVEDLDQHILDEEVDLFPYAMYELRGPQWDRVAEVHASTVA